MNRRELFALLAAVPLAPWQKNQEFDIDDLMEAADQEWSKSENRWVAVFKDSEVQFVGSAEWWNAYVAKLYGVEP